MGKTKTAVIGGVTEDKKSGEEKYKERQKQKDKVRTPGLGGGERVATVDAGPIIEDTNENPSEENSSVKRGPKTRGKQYKKAKSKIDKSKTYKLKEAVSLVKETAYAKFDGSVEMHVKIKKEGFTKQVTLPHSTGKKKKVEFADENTIKKLKQGKVDFDVLLATPETMPKIVPFAKILGPKGLMPNPKNGTLIKSEKDAKNFSEDAINLKTEKKQPVVHTVIGKVSNKEKELVENAETVINEIGKKQIVSAYLTSTMGPSVKLEV